ncbi:MAG: Zn-dependent hydrolase [Bacteroidales bacterium]|nr:Zn-dependent hydrolase [Bacteroidales bacterium]
MKKILFMTLMSAALIVMSCNGNNEPQNNDSPLKEKVAAFKSVPLTADLSDLSENEKAMLPLLFKAANIMDDLYWIQAYGDKKALMESVTDSTAQAFIQINYGPWERLDGNKPFIEGVGEKPAGANFYPTDMTKEEFEAWDEPLKTNLYTMIRRDENGKLKAIPYSEFFKDQLTEAAGYIKEAAALAEDEGLKTYLELRADALLSNDYYPSDVAWMRMRNNNIDFVCGPIENYEDALYGYKTSWESFVLKKDQEWSKKLEHYIAILPELQKALPCEQVFKDETPGAGSDMGVYEALYYQGDCNAGSKTIAINLPNDEKVRNEEGSRKLQLKNSMQAKFDYILKPIADELIAEDQRMYIDFDAFFENVMFHEVSHGLGRGQTIKGDQTVREALQNYYTSIEEAKADILGLWCITYLFEQDSLSEKCLMQNYVTFFAGIFRSVRFGAASAHGKANMMCFYFFEKAGAFTRDEATGTYSIDFEKMHQAMLDLSNWVLTVEGNGDFEAAKAAIEERGYIRDTLQKDLDRIAAKGIPQDIRFEQSISILGL